MTNEEAIEVIKRDALYNPESATIAINAIEKQIPKKITVTYAGFMCPSCRTIYCYTHYDDDYCYACGQRLLWEDEEWHLKKQSK